MIPRKLKLAIVSFPYGGNGGIQSEHPDIRRWFAKTLFTARTNPKYAERISEVVDRNFADTPIPMTRNAAVKWARDERADVLVMVDSDQSIDPYLGQLPWIKPFFDSSFDFLYAHWDKGPSVIFAPYCAHPPGAKNPGSYENVHVFQWVRDETEIEGEPGIKLSAYEPSEAAQWRGIAPVGAGPTGCIMYDMRAFDLTDPVKQYRRFLDAGHNDETARALTRPWFYYEWKDVYQAEKHSTEDVTNTRDISLHGLVELGYNPLYCNWDAWAGHWKPKCVGMPRVHTADQVGESFRLAVLNNIRDREHKQFLGGEQTLEMLRPRRRPEQVLVAEPSNNGHSTNGHGRFVWSDSVNPAAKPEPSGPIPEHSRMHGWSPVKAVGLALAKFVQETVPAEGVVVDIGPGPRPFPLATHFVGRQVPDHPNSTVIDFEKDRLPFEDQSVDFVHCRHVLEDLRNPEHLLCEIRRVAKAGYIETPSPIVELCRGVDAGENPECYPGYAHHRWLLWPAGDSLFLMPKYAQTHQHGDLVNRDELQEPLAWNTYFVWTGEFSGLILENELAYRANCDSYRVALSEAVEASRKSTLAWRDALASGELVVAVARLPQQEATP